MSKTFTAYDVQRRKLDKLMSEPEKPVVIPERRDERKFPDAPEFVRNIMGSSAGAGSGEFHVYRHLRRKEYARQRFITEQARREDADIQFQERVQAKQAAAEARTAKKRAKRLKRKQNLKKKKSSDPQTGTGTGPDTQSDEESEDGDSDDKKETGDGSKEHVVPAVGAEAEKGMSRTCSQTLMS